MSDSEMFDWQTYAKPLMSMGDRLVALLDDPDDRDLQMEIYHMIYMGLSTAYMNVALEDGQQPEYWPFPSPTGNFGSPNPDAAYFFVKLDPEGVYKISGYRGTVRVLDFQIGGGTFLFQGTGDFGKVLANYNLDDLTLDKNDGSFEFILSTERPEGYDGDWRLLDPNGTYIAVRQFAYDWAEETDGRFAIDRLDVPALQPVATPGDIAKKLQTINQWAENWTKFSIDWVKRYKSQGLINRVAIQDISGIAGASMQAYYDGLFDLQEDEALILESEIPEQARYWGITLNNMLWSQIDYMNHSRQSSLNGHTARIDSDGKFRAVISIQDPGVPNWLDTAGYRKGTILGRWMECSSSPEPVITKVKVSQVRDHLPKDTPVVTPEERDQAARARKTAAQLRRRW